MWHWDGARNTVRRVWAVSRTSVGSLCARGLFGLAIGGVIVTAAYPAARSGSGVDDLLTRRMGFAAADLRSLDTGAAAIKSLDTPVREELAHVGVVYVAVPPERFLERFRDIERFERGSRIPQIGRFSNPPRLEDLEGLAFPGPDVAVLPACRPGDCDVKLSGAAMRRFRNDVDWSSPDAARQANDVARRMILELVRAYQQTGNAALGRYEDGKKPMPAAEPFRALLSADDPLPAPVPALLTYLDTYPRGRPAGAEDFFYWSVIDFGLKPTIRVNHVTIYPLGAGAPQGVPYAITIKQLYASHYFHATLELRFLIDDERHSAGRGTSLVSVTRSRSDGMTGFKGRLLRPVISRRSREAMRRYLEHMKRQVERPDPAAFGAQVVLR